MILQAYPQLLPVHWNDGIFSITDMRPALGGMINRTDIWSQVSRRHMPRVRQVCQCDRCRY